MAARRFVSRGGEKLQHAIDSFGVDAAGLVCADLGCSTGGFTDCLLRAGAVRVYAVDTAYGQLDWTLRNDPRVVVMERTNALHARPPEPAGAGVDLVVMDLGWTPQRLAVPAAAGWLRPGGRIISLIKPHYELTSGGRGPRLVGGVLPDDDADRVARECMAQLDAAGFRVIASTPSPIKGSGGKGNREWLALIAPPSPPFSPPSSESS